MPKISVLVPIYNAEKYLERCLDSILQQTLSDMEILCMDDGSTDSTSAILEEYAKKDSRIRVIHKLNTGYGHTMNQALNLAVGDYVGIVESDDTIPKDMYEILYQVVRDNDLDFVKTDFYHVWDTKEGDMIFEYKCLTDRTEFYNKVIKPNDELGSYFLEKYTWNALYRREFLEKNRIRHNQTPGASYQDNGFWFQTFYYANRVMFLDKAFYRYRQDNPNSSVFSDQKVYAMKDEYDFIRTFLKDKNEKEIRLYHIAFHFRMLGYFFRLGHIAESYKEEFAKVIQKECRMYEELGEACYEWMMPYQVKLLERLKTEPEKYVTELLEANAKIRASVAGYSHIIIYGAGNFGKQVFHKLKKIQNNDFNIYFAITDTGKNRDHYFGNIIYKIDDFTEEKDSALVILAVSKNSSAYQEMSDRLNELGFVHIKHSSEI